MATPVQFADKADFIAALKAARPAAVAADKAALAKHKADRKAEVEAFRAKCQRYARMSVAAIEAELEGREKYSMVSLSLGRPDSCPRSQVATIDRALVALEQTAQKTFTVADTHGNFSHLYRFICPPVADSICGGD